MTSTPTTDAETDQASTRVVKIDYERSNSIEVLADEDNESLAFVHVTRYTDGTAGLALDMCVKYSGGHARFGAEDARRIATALLDGATLIEHRPAAS
ncbi:MAG TPA: hypothetical protein VGL39_23265 [Jatrophihabitantaceae bacterium]|jgi:hypothetical protein